MDTTFTRTADSVPGDGRTAAPATPALPPAEPGRHGGGYWGTLTAVGAVGGLMSGLFAIGGGIVMVPLLIWRLRLDQRQAAATALVAVIPAAAGASVPAAYAALAIPPALSAILFATVLLAVAAQLTVKALPARPDNSGRRHR